MVAILAYVLCAFIWLIDTEIGAVTWYCWVLLAIAVLCCLGRQFGQWRLSRRELAIFGFVEMAMIVSVMILEGWTHSPLFLVGALVLVEQGHRIGTRWGLIIGLISTIAVCVGKFCIGDQNFVNTRFALVFGSELAFWPIAGVMQLRLYAPAHLRDNVSRAGGPTLAMSDMSEANIITLLNTTTNRLYSLLDLFRQQTVERDMNRLIYSAVRFAKETTNSDIAVLLLPEDDDSLNVICSVGEGVVADNSERGDLSILRDVIRTEKPYMFRSEQINVGQRVPWCDHAVKAYCAVPMIDTLNNEPLGVLVVANDSNRQEYEPGTADFLMLLAAQTGVALRNDRLVKDLSKVSNDMLNVLARILETKETDCAGHVLRVVENAVALARTQGLSKDVIDEIAQAAVLHDVGKICIPDDVLNKTGPLNSKEFALLKEHTTKAREILGDVSVVSPNALDMIVHHHERFDGAGYPDGLAGEKINLGARIIAIVDEFDGMISDKPKRHGLPVEKALESLVENKGKMFDPKLVDSFVEQKRDELEQEVRLRDNLC